MSSKTKGLKYTENVKFLHPNWLLVVPVFSLCSFSQPSFPVLLLQIQDEIYLLYTCALASLFELKNGDTHMSRVMRKPVFGVSDQGCTTIEDG